jgi:hypothetical protein
VALKEYCKADPITSPVDLAAATGREHNQITRNNNNETSLLELPGTE